jgi:hypothetical protein
MSNKYEIYKKPEQFKYNPQKKNTSFYQICQFKNPQTGKYQIRKIIFNEHGTILKTYEKEYTKEKIDIFGKNNRRNKYSTYAVSDLKLINLPEPSFILEAQSELLNNDYNDKFYNI